MKNRQTDGGVPDLASVLAALDDKCSGPDGDAKRRQTHAHRRGILTLVMIVVLVGGVIQLLTSTPEAPRTANGGSRASIVFSNAGTGTCLSWPPDAPDKPSFVQCRSDHMFEVAKPVDMNGFGEPCQLAVREYLGTHYDPNSRFTISVLWAGDADGTNTGSRNLLCGLQLLGQEGKPMPFKGRIVDLDQSKVWAPGTCLGLDSANRSTDIPVDCSTPHGLEVTGSVEPGRAVHGEPAVRRGAALVHHRGLHPHGRRLPGARPAEHVGAVPRCRAGVRRQLGGGQQAGVVRHRQARRTGLDAPVGKRANVVAGRSASPTGTVADTTPAASAQRVGARASSGLRRTPDSDRAAADRDPAARADDHRRTTHRDSCPDHRGSADRGPRRPRRARRLRWDPHRDRRRRRVRPARPRHPESSRFPAFRRSRCPATSRRNPRLRLRLLPNARPLRSGCGPAPPARPA